MPVSATYIRPSYSTYGYGYAPTYRPSFYSTMPCSYGYGYGSGYQPYWNSHSVRVCNPATAVVDAALTTAALFTLAAVFSR